MEPIGDPRCREVKPGAGVCIGHAAVALCDGTLEPVKRRIHVSAHGMDFRDLVGAAVGVLLDQLGHARLASVVLPSAW
jgi:hypothetical protein